MNFSYIPIKSVFQLRKALHRILGLGDKISSFLFLLFYICYRPIFLVLKTAYLSPHLRQFRVYPNIRLRYYPLTPQIYRIHWLNLIKFCQTYKIALINTNWFWCHIQILIKCFKLFLVLLSALHHLWLECLFFIYHIR